MKSVDHIVVGGGTAGCVLAARCRRTRARGCCCWKPARRSRPPGDQRPVGGLGHHTQIVGDDDRRGTGLLLHGVQDVQHLRLDGHVRITAARAAAGVGDPRTAHGDHGRRSGRAADERRSGPIGRDQSAVCPTAARTSAVASAGAVLSPRVGGSGVFDSPAGWMSAVLQPRPKTAPNGARPAAKGQCSNVCSSRIESCPPARSPPRTASSPRPSTR